MGKVLDKVTIAANCAMNIPVGLPPKPPTANSRLWEIQRALPSDWVRRGEELKMPIWPPPPHELPGVGPQFPPRRANDLPRVMTQL